MAQQTISIGSTANDGTGDSLRVAFNKINSMFTELYGETAVDSKISFSGNKISSNVLCSRQELLLRHFNATDDDKIWFINPLRIAFI